MRKLQPSGPSGRHERPIRSSVERATTATPCRRLARHRRIALAACAIAGIGSFAADAQAQVRMVALDETTQEVTIRNFGTGTVDVSGYQMCRQPGTYRALSALTIVGGGDLTLSPGEEVTLVYTFILEDGTGIGLYLNNLGFGNSANMADYMQYKGVAGVREIVAVGAGIWTAGTFASGDSGPYVYTGDGSQNGAAFWASASSSVPGLGVLGAILLAGLLVSIAVVASRPAAAR